MANSEDSQDQPHHNINIQTALLTALDEARQQSPGRFPKPVHVLAAVDDSVDGQWEERLQQANEDRIRESIVLIPYNTGDFHWIGVIIQFKEDGKIELAEFIDSVKDSTFIPDKLQKQFAKVYPGVTLRSKNFEKHDDPKQGASLTIENLLKAAEELEPAEIKYPSVDNLHSQIVDDQETSTCLIKNEQSSWQHEEQNVPALTSSQGNESKLFSLEQRLNSGLTKLRIQDGSKLSEKVQRTEQRIKDYEEDENKEEVEREMKVLSELQELQALTEEIHILKISMNSNQSKIRDLEEKFQNELVRLRVQDVSKLPEKIKQTEARINDYKEDEMTQEAEKEMKVLSELRELQGLLEEIDIIKSATVNLDDTNESKLRHLQQKMNRELVRLKIQDVSKLPEKIKRTEERISEYEEDEMTEEAEREMEVLKELRELQGLIEEINIIKFDTTNSEDNNESKFRHLKQKMNSELVRLKIRDVSKLPEKIKRTERRIKDYEEDENTAVAQRETKILVELQALQELVSEIGALESSSLVREMSFPSQLPEQNEVSIKEANTDHPNDDTIDNWKQDDCPITEESLVNMENDFLSIPSCAERSIICLLYYISLKLVGNAIVSDHSIKIPDRIETEIENEFERLKERLKIEELESNEIRNSVEISIINVKNENWKSACITLRKIFKKISPLNMQEMFRLLEKVDDAARLTKNKDIIFFLGGTGSGKSTAIHFLAGSKMIEKKVEGLNHIAPVEIKNSDLKNITTSPFARSETRYITPVTVSFEDVGGCNNGSIILCDSPGFEDTNGAEVDIANEIGIVKAIKGCKSVRPVVLISYKSIGDRCEGVKSVAYMLMGLIPEIKDNIKALSFIFTKYPQHEKDTIHASLENIRRKMNDAEKSDPSFMRFFKDILRKTEGGARTIDLFNDKPGKILDDLAESTAIYHPEEVFQFSITEKSKAIVQQQVTKYQLSIMSATKGAEYLLVKYKLDQLKRLNDLLGEDYIKNIYNDCVRFISRYLSKEYKEGTSSLNRCLTSQIVLSKEDIQQYQACIDHAKLAEELRNKHLGKEVIHSSAFIQYLNQEVDIMLGDLKKKNIDDSSVKTSLDKLKLLSMSFLDIDYKYKNVCQFLAEKFGSVVKSFKSSVLVNKFDTSADDITKLYNSLTILQDHLDHEDMRVKYMELIEYFIKYLNDSVAKLSHILNQEKLERRDVDSVSSCVGMLETANNTYGLQPHISRKDIDDVYENLLSKILKHVEEIITKMNTQFKNENSFHILEQYMEELDLIRTISVMKPKTTESYCSILEKLVGYIQEARRDAEELLRVLFQRKEKVNYDKLTKCLSSLENAKWIEKYRADVYSNLLSGVKEHIIQHVKGLKTSVMEVSLDLDNFDKIEQVYKIISEINEMKNFEKIVPDLAPYIDEVNSWFEEVTKNVFIIIKDTFSLEKWKEQGYKTLDFSKAEKAFHYLDACRKIRVLLKSDCMSMLNSLEEFIQYFSNYVQTEIERCFQTIKLYEDKNKKEMFEKARSLAKRLQEVLEIKIKYSRIFSCFSNQKIIEQWQSDLSNYLTELSDEMEKLNVTQQTEALSTKLLVVKALSILDSFLQGEKYIDVYCKYQNIFFSQTTDVCKQVIDAIKSNDYERVASEMVVLEAAGEVGKHFSKQAKRTLNVGLDNLMEETKTKAIMLGNNIEMEGIKCIVENLKRMQRAKQFISQYLDTPDPIDACITEVTNLMKERIKRFLEGVEALIDINNFFEADKKIDSITLVRTLLGKYCTEDVSKQIEELKKRQDNMVLNDVVNKYSDMDISGYTLNPPTDIFAKFGEVNNTNPIYNQALNTIKEKILAKFRAELEKAKLKMPPDPENLHIRKFESAVKYLPESMRNALEVELKHCKDDINQLIRYNDINLNNALSSGDLNSIRSVLEEYNASEGMQSYVNKGRQLVLKQVQEIMSKVNQNFEQYDVREALVNVKKLYEYKIELENIVAIRQPYLDVKSQIVKKFQEAYLCFNNLFINNNMPAISNETVIAAEKSFLCLIEFMKFNDGLQDQPVLAIMFSEDINTKIVELNRKISDYFSEYQKKYKDALEKLDISSLKDILDVTCKWNSLFTKIKEYSNMHCKNQNSVNTYLMVLNQLTSYSHMLESVSHKIEELRDELINQQLINDHTKGYNKDRDAFYKKLNEKFAILRKAKLFDKYNLSIDINQIEQECLRSLARKITEIFNTTDKFLENFSEESKLAKHEYDKFDLYYRNLVSFKQEMTGIMSDVNEKIEQIDQKFFDKIQSWESLAGSTSMVQNIAKCLINMKNVSNNIPSFKDRINEKIDDAMKNYKVAKGIMTFAKLGGVLSEDKTGIGRSIISEHKLLHGYWLSLFNEKTRRHDVIHVLANLKGDFVDTEQLKKRYDEFYEIYTDLVKQYLKPNMELDKLIMNAKLIAGNTKQKPNHIEWDADIRNRVPKLAAHIFALWTLKNADYYFEAEGLIDKDNYLLQPHAAQVISIFRMLGIGDKKEELKNNLVQIATGEGKSVTLGVTASILAQLGFDVRCACYSEYLSQRDYTTFLPLMVSLDLTSYIRYGTFNKLCEDMINENGDIRQTVEQLISKGSNNTKQNNQQLKRAKILLIDEVDVFFSRDFYGNVYTPSASLRDPTITSLVSLIWTHRLRKPKLDLNSVKITDEYKACCNRFPKWETLIQEAIKDMLLDVNNFESHDYVVNQDKIGYIEQDNTVYNVVYGYKTLFAYYCEQEKGRISKESLDENISIRIKCGSFSYAEIPLEFKYIMGVTGTLQTLSDPEKTIIRNDYKIDKNTFTPSVYGRNNLKFTEKDDLMIENSDDYFNVIRRQIDDNLKGKSSEKRAVLVLFESKQKLKDFYNSRALEPIKDMVVYLTEEASLIEKDSLIKRATTSGQITLFPRTFGRGTDFVCYDQNVATNGGTHVIQTFLSEEVSEEVQIKGRTARQGDYGSYSMVLLDSDLERFHIEREHIEDVKKGRPVINRITDALVGTKKYHSVYDLLHDKRMDSFKIQYEANTKFVEQAKERHLAAQTFLSNLYSEKVEAVSKFLVEENKGAQGIWSSRTVCLMDATGSMHHLLHKCKNTVTIMFERTSEILKDNNISSDSFQIQFVVYRNYNSKEDKILQSSPWETKPDNLRAFMNTIEVKGGLGNEAVEIGLWHANKENERENITQVILIGDAPPNSKNEVTKRRERWGEEYWHKTRFAQSTYYEDEIQKLKSNGIPVHAFFVKSRAEQSFKEIAKGTNGRCQMLDINSPSGSRMLTDLVTEEILRNVGGSSKGNDLVEAYRKKFGKSYK